MVQPDLDNPSLRPCFQVNCQFDNQNGLSHQVSSGRGSSITPGRAGQAGDSAQHQLSVKVIDAAGGTGMVCTSYTVSLTAYLLSVNHWDQPGSGNTALSVWVLMGSCLGHE